METSDSQGMTNLSQESFAKFAHFITAELGIKMPDSKLTLVQSRLLRRVRELRLGSLEQYGEYFFTSGNSQERDEFINAITTNKTEFFREPDHFRYLVENVLPTISPNASQLKVWSAACSSGEEPYTLAMLLSEYRRLAYGFDFAILATDVSTRVLAQARQGIDQESQIEPVPPDMRSRYLLRSRDKSKDQVRIVPELRQKVSFHRLNFMDDSYRIADMFDIIFCRNVLIYFDRPTQEAVINKICRNLVPGGYLFIGHSESLNGLDVPLSVLRTAIFRKLA